MVFRPDKSDPLNPNKRVYVIYNNLILTKRIDPMSNHREGCKCPLHHIIEGVSVPLQHRNNQQRYPQSQPQPQQYIRLTQKQRTFLSECVFKQQWIRLQLEETEELQRYEVFTVTPWQKQKITAIHDIEKRLLETYQISLTHYIVIQETKKTRCNYNTTCGPLPLVRPRSTVQTQVQAMAQAQAHSQKEAKKQPVPVQGPKMKPESKPQLRNYGFTPDGEPLYSYYEAGQTMPIRSGGLLNVRPARFLQNDGFTNIQNDPVLENMNRNYVRQMGNTNNVDSGGSLSSGCSTANVGSEDINAGIVDSGGNSVYGSNGRIGGYDDNAGAYDDNTEVCAMEMQDVDSHTTRRVVLNAMQQANFNSYRSRKNWLRPPFGSVPYLVQRRHSESDKLLPYGKDQDGFKRPHSPPFAHPRNPPFLRRHTPPFVVSTADKNDGDNPHIPTVATGCASNHEILKPGNTTQKNLGNNVMRRPNPPYVYPKPPPPYSTSLYAQYMQSTQHHSQLAKQHLQTDQKYMQLRQQHPQPVEQYPQLGQEYPQPTQQYTPTSEEFMQTPQKFLPTTHHYPQSTYKYMETTHQYTQLDDQYVQPTEQYTQFAQQYVLPPELYGQFAQGTISATTYYV